MKIQLKKFFFKTVASLLIIAFLINYLIENWNKIAEIEYSVDWYYLSLSLLTLLISLFFLPLALRNIVGILEYRISIKKICFVLFYSQIAKYLPGGIWGYVGRVYLYKKEGMNARDASTCVILETLLVFLSGIFVFLISLWFLNKIPSIELILSKYANEIVMIVLIASLSLLHPRMLNLLWGLIPEKISKDRLQFDYNYFSLLRPAILLVFFWLGIGVGFWLLLRSFFYISLNLMPMVIGIYVFAWIIGFLAFFTPGGLGAREGVLILVLNFYLPVYISAIMAIASRIWWIIGELVWVIISFVWSRFEGVSKGTSE